MPNETTALLERLRAASELDWRATRDELHDLHKKAATFEERGALLAIYVAVMDQVERSGAITDIEKFREVRRQDYNLFLVREAADDAGNITPEVLLAVTEREIAAGRMAEADEMRKLALAGRLLSQPNDKPTSLRRWVQSIFGGR
jgi:hypothetical protein